MAVGMVIIGLPVSQVRAQDGSSIPPQDTSTSTLETATSSQVLPREVTPRPTVTVPTSPISIPITIVNEPISESIPTEAPASNIYTILVLVSAVLVAGGYGAYKLQNKKKNQSKDIKDESHCLNLKKLMEEKLKELTNLKGQLESRIKETGREQAREVISGTRVGEVFKQVESVKADYDKLKQLYEKCIIEFEVSQRVILVDAVFCFVSSGGKIFEDMHALLETYPQKKILLTGADDEQFKKFGLDKVPYEVFTLKHDPEKTDPKYYQTILSRYSLKADEIVYFEHNPEAVKSAQSIGINTYFYDDGKKDLAGLKDFLDKNL